MTRRRRRARAYPAGPYLVATFANLPGLWYVLRDNGRAIAPPYASLAAAIIAAHQLARPPPAPQRTP